MINFMVKNISSKDLENQVLKRCMLLFQVFYITMGNEGPGLAAPFFMHGILEHIFFISHILRPNKKNICGSG